MNRKPIEKVFSFPAQSTGTLLHSARKGHQIVFLTMQKTLSAWSTNFVYFIFLIFFHLGLCPCSTEL